MHSQVPREKSYGCAVFALQDAIAYLRDPNFFNRILCSEEQVHVDEEYKIEVITFLPPEHMIGTQSSQLLKDYRNAGGEFNQVLLGRKKTLQDYLNSNEILASNGYDLAKSQNHYTTKKLFKYLKLIVRTLETLSPEEVESIIRKTLVTADTRPLQLRYIQT